MDCGGVSSSYVFWSQRKTSSLDVMLEHFTSRIKSSSCSLFMFVTKGCEVGRCRSNSLTEYLSFQIPSCDCNITVSVALGTCTCWVVSEYRQEIDHALSQSVCTRVWSIITWSTMYIPLLNWGYPTCHPAARRRMQKEFQSINQSISRSV